MRASELIGRSVTLADGSTRRVVSLRLVQDGPPLGPMAALRVDEVVLGRRWVGGYLGYQDRDQRGPWLLRQVVLRLHRGTIVVPWDEVAEQLVGPRGGPSPGARRERHDEE